MALRRVGGGFEITAARPAGYDRPWARAACRSRGERPDAAALDAARAPQPTRCDAARRKDLEPDD